MKCWIRRAIASTRLKVCVLDRVFLFQRLVMGADGSRGELRAAQCGVCPVIFPVPLRSVPLHAPLLVMFGAGECKGTCGHASWERLRARVWEPLATGSAGASLTSLDRGDDVQVMETWDREHNRLL